MHAPIFYIAFGFGLISLALLATRTGNLLTSINGTECNIEWCDGRVSNNHACNAPGEWHCVTCHNLDMWEHAASEGNHVIGWSCSKHKRIEETIPWSYLNEEIRKAIADGLGRPV